MLPQAVYARRIPLSSARELPRIRLIADLTQPIARAMIRATNVNAALTRTCSPATAFRESAPPTASVLGQEPGDTTSEPLP